MWSIISAAGWPIWPLIFASVVALAIVIERCLALRTSILVPAGLTQDVIKTLNQFTDRQNLTRLSGHSPLGAILAGGLSAHANGLDAKAAMEEQGLSVAAQFEKHLDLLSLIASAAPLMGLLGTVVGMIEIFAIQGQAAQSPEAMAAGIAVALYNTAFGLIVAIPALVAYRLLKMRIQHLLDQIEKEVTPLEQVLVSAKARHGKKADKPHAS